MVTMTQTTEVPESTAPHHRVAIIGSGFAGLGMAIRFRQHRIDDFVILERADDLGGTWYANTYPGCQCDVPSLLYSYSFAPNPDWSRAYAPQAEIEEYIRRCADHYDVKRSVRFGHDVLDARWDADARRWSITTSQGPYTADLLVVGSGGLSEPALPDIPGLADFEGAVFHSARWDHDHDLTGERVAAIGTGASAIQFVPRIQQVADHLSVFQRTAPWIIPRNDRAFTGWERALFRRVPLAQRLARAFVYWTRELLVIPLTRRPAMTAVAAGQARRYLEAQVADPELRERLTPDYTLGCKRVLLSDDYLQSLTRPNVALVTSGIREVRAHDIVTEDGTEHPVDTIVLGTGFEATEPPIARRVHGRDGRTMREHWADGMEAYLGTTVAGFPNLFMLTGPNTGLGHSSMILMMESQFNYIIDAVETMDARNLATLEVRPPVVADYNRALQRRLGATVWNSGCSSWYLDANGRNTLMWPDFTWKFRQRTRRFDAASYTTSYR